MKEAEFRAFIKKYRDHPPKLRRYHVLESWVKKHGWTYGVEIGVLKGSTTFFLLETCPSLRMVGVDVWRPKPEKAGQDGGCTYAELDMDEIFKDVTALARHFGTRCELRREESVAAAAAYADGIFDFCFIDGDHTEPGVRADIRAWAPKVMMNGLLSGHDCQWPSVRRVLNELVPGWTRHPNDVWALERKNLTWM